MEAIREKSISAKLGMNSIIMNLMFSDVFVWSTYYLGMPVAAIYLADQLGFEAARAIGVGTGIYFLMRSVAQIPVGWLIDRLRTYVDEALFVTFGVLLMSFSFSIYPLITQEVHLYIAQALFGLGVAFNLPAWRKLFSRFVDKGREGMEWSIYDTILSFCMAVAATLGGTLAVICGFPFLFNISALLILFGGILPLFLLREKAIKAQNAKVV